MKRNTYIIKLFFQEDSSVNIVENRENRVITQKDIENSPSIIIEVLLSKNMIEEISGDVLDRKKLKINAAGLENYMRGGTDGVVFFGKLNDYVNNIHIKLK